MNPYFNEQMITKQQQAVALQNLQNLGLLGFSMKWTRISTNRINPEFQAMYQELANQFKQQLVVETQKLQQDQALHLEQLQTENNNRL